MLLTDISQAVTDRYTTETIASARMSRFIAAAVRYYSRYVPLVIDYHFHTVNEVSTYTMPADCILVLDVFYFPGGDPLEDVESVASTLYDIPVEYHHMPSHRVIDDINEATAWTGLRGFWEEEHAAHSVRIWPEPTGAIEVKVRYAAGHAINVGGTAYTTIPAEDLSIIADLVMAEILRAKAVEFSVEPDYVLGQQRETKGHLVENAMRMAADLRNSVHHKYGNNAVFAAP